MTVSIKRVYEDASQQDGFRVLVDRLWPRGVSKKNAQLDEWLKDVAPSAELRGWFDHDPDRFNEFVTRYRAELDDNQVVGFLRELIAKHPRVTLLYGARNPDQNQAVVLRDYLAEILGVAGG